MIRMDSGLGLFTLDDKGNPVAEPDIEKWADWMKIGSRCVGNDKIGDAMVSTIFLAINSDITKKVPVLWETMVFGGQMHLDQYRCAGSREQAEAMHAMVVEKVKAAGKKL